MSRRHQNLAPVQISLESHRNKEPLARWPFMVRMLSALHPGLITPPRRGLPSSKGSSPAVARSPLVGRILAERLLRSRQNCPV